ncbi:MAG: transporter related protein [Gemmatimonadetes bacterium]|nr:transporter related protein [Gemmatimonadota bacterium]
MTAAVVAEHLVKRYDGVVALDDVSFEVSEGELFGFIGPDGGGKTTLFRILVTLLLPDGGSARVLGRDVVTEMWELRRRIGYMPGRFALYPDLSVEENLGFFASVFGTTIREQYEQIAPIYKHLEPFRQRRAGALSGGMKQKLALCCALVHRPEILLLDEPTTGVDAVSRREFWDLLASLRKGGLTILVSTPYMDEADRCDRVALVQRGRLLAIDTPAGVARGFDRPLLAVRATDRYRALQLLRAYPHARSVYPFGETLHYTDERLGVATDDVARDLTAHLGAQGLVDVDASPITPSIEDAFIALMGSAESGSATERSAA